MATFTSTNFYFATYCFENSITEIGGLDSNGLPYKSLSNNKIVENVFFPNKIIKIGPKAFYMSTALKRTVLRSTKIERIEESAFEGCSSLRVSIFL